MKEIMYLVPITHFSKICLIQLFVWTFLILFCLVLTLINRWVCFMTRHLVRNHKVMPKSSTPLAFPYPAKQRPCLLFALLLSGIIPLPLPLTHVFCDNVHFINTDSDVSPLLSDVLFHFTEVRQSSSEKCSSCF